MITAPTAKAITMPDKPFPPLELAELDVEFEAVEFESTDEFDAAAGVSSCCHNSWHSAPCQEEANINTKKIKISNTFIFIFK